MNLWPIKITTRFVTQSYITLVVEWGKPKSVPKSCIVHYPSDLHNAMMDSCMKVDILIRVYGQKITLFYSFKRSFLKALTFFPTNLLTFFPLFLTFLNL